MQRFILAAIGGALLLSGCAGTSSEFECNATTFDGCMTTQQANDNAKLKEEGNTIKPAVLPHLAEGDFSSLSPKAEPSTKLVTQPNTHNPFSGQMTATPVVSKAVVQATTTPYVQRDYPRPLRVGEHIAQLWIAPYIDTADIYHQPSNVVFVVTPSHWGKPRIN